MSKAFTKEDDEAGFEPPPPRTPSAGSAPFHLTHAGALRLAQLHDDHVRNALAHAQRLPPQPARPERAALGVTVRVRRDGGEPRRYRLVSAEEHALLGDGCSVDSPLGRALLGARPGDVVDLELPQGSAELEVVALEGESED